MKFRNVIHRLLWGINPKKWMSFNYLKSHSLMLKDLASSLTPGRRPPSRSYDSFTIAMQRAGVSEAKLEQAKRQNIIAVKIFLTVSALTFLYACYLFRDFSVEAIMVVMLSLLSLVYAWREHHNYIKLKYRKLYLSPKEWFKLAIK
jgi:hypothetical protein